MLARVKLPFCANVVGDDVLEGNVAFLNIYFCIFRVWWQNNPVL